MTEATLPGLEARPYTVEDSYDEHAVRIINRVKETFIADRDKLRNTIQHGGTHLEMRAAVDAYQAIQGTINGLELAIDRVLGHDTPTRRTM